MLYCLSPSSSFQPLFLITTRFMIKMGFVLSMYCFPTKVDETKTSNMFEWNRSGGCEVPCRGGSNIQRRQNAKDGEMIHRPQWRRWHQRWLQCWLHGKTQSPLLVPPSPRSWPQSKIPLQFMNAGLKDLVNTNMTTTKCVTGRKWIQTNKSLSMKSKAKFNYVCWKVKSRSPTDHHSRKRK